MKATGIIRRIDELGRIVIPKELRKSLRIKENENLEIYIDEEEKIILQKFSAMKKINDFAQNFVDAMHSFIKFNIIVTDNNEVVAVSNSKKKEYLNKQISEKLVTAIMRRENYLEKYIKDYEIIEGLVESGSYVISTIIANGDAVGLVMITSANEDLTKAEENVVKIASQFFSKYLEQ